MAGLSILVQVTYIDELGMKFLNEKSMLVALKSGDSAAFDAIYAVYSKMLYIYLQDKLKDQDLCCDILQDIFVSLWEKREMLQIDISLKAYLYQSIRYKIVDQYRRNSKYQKYLNDLGQYLTENCCMPVDNIDHKRRLTAVMHTIDQLPCRMKEIFILSRFEHLSVNSIAEKLSISPQTVKNQLSKALHILRENNAEVYLVSVPLLLRITDTIN